MSNYSVGSLVKFRGREWTVAPGEDPDLLNLRPLTGGGSDICGVYLPLEAAKIEPATFPLPGANDIGDFEAARLLGDAARLLIRDGAGPFRSFGHLSFRPRPYQLVPLLMALRLDAVRMIIADDVGIGKTIEAALIGRELLDRGMVRRMAVLCPPYLCDQWHDELRDKFSIDAKVIRSDTLSRLERELPRQDLSVFGYYPNIIVSVDFAKTDRHRDQFLQHCPELVIVDEAHGCARPAGAATAQQQRHHLISDLAKNESKHILLVTATPHSGIEESFLSLLGFIKPGFAQIDMNSPDPGTRAELARHFVQRRRGDVVKWMGAETQFPERVPVEATFALSPEYEALFRDLYKFAGELVASAESSTGTRRRVRYWTALALLRCVMSSPAAAVAALQTRMDKVSEDTVGDDYYSASILDPTEAEKVMDVLPTYAVDQGEYTFSESEKRRLRDFTRKAESLKGDADTKIKEAAARIAGLLRDGFKPIVFCRFIETAEYVARELSGRLARDFNGLQVACVTGDDHEDDRKTKVAEISRFPRRVLVATDCLSEGINLQDGFNAVLHYDLPWNPNRLDQREGRVDRFGQTSKQVRTILLYGSNNPIDGTVFKVLLRKAREIRTKLGVTVPIPVDSESIMETVLKALFMTADGGYQLSLLDQGEVPALADAHRKWDAAAEREKISRSVFAQHALKPAEVEPELKAADSVLGDPAFVRRFVMNACQRLNSPANQTGPGVLALNLDNLAQGFISRVTVDSHAKLAFEQPAPEGTVFVSRNHPLVSALAEYVLDSAFDPSGSRSLGARSGVVICREVTRRTTLLLLRLRFAVQEAQAGITSLAEECLLTGFEADSGARKWLNKEEAEKVLLTTQPCANISTTEKAAAINALVGAFAELKPEIEFRVKQRAGQLLGSYERLRRTIRGNRISVEAILPVDVLSIVILLPEQR
ncbi:MAG: DEAD/DEAH box helicase [Chloroflexi bacterium]|nr:DEAD/DEAH box helicase [Chloroflexota bacterium]